MITQALHNGIVKGALTGIVAAAVVDVHAFRTWKCWQDALTYNWGIATFRWAQGAVLGAVTAAGFGAFGA